MSTATAAVLCGIGADLPPAVTTNEDLTEWLVTSDEWIRSRTGVRERRFNEEKAATSDLAVGAGSRALASAGRPDVDMVLLATTTPDHQCPATAPDVAARLSCGSVPAFDLSAVCSGFLYGLSVASGLIESGRAGTILLVASDTFSTILDTADRSTAAVFGDGAGAVVLRRGSPDEPGAVGVIDLGSDGTMADLITVPGGGSRQRALGVGPDPGAACFTMQGRAVFVQAVRHMTRSIRRVLDAVGTPIEDVDRLVAHQANLRILRSVGQQLGLGEERVVVDLDRVGNTAAASIPLALDEAVSSGRVRPGDRVVLSAFGGGVTWGSTLITWPELDIVS